MSKPVKFSTSKVRVEKKKSSVNFCSCAGLLLLVLALIFGLLGISQYSVYASFENSKTLNKDAQEFTVVEGDTVDSISARLVEEGLLEKSAILNIPTYKIFFQFHSVNSTIHPGVYEIPAQTEFKKVFDYLRPSACEVVNVTLKEGNRIEEFAEQLERDFTGKTKSSFSKDEFVSISRNLSSAFINPRDEIGLSFTPPNNLEGYLFPDTYQFCSDASAKTVIQRMLKTFDQKIYTPNKSSVESSQYSLGELVNVASMLERETFSSDERPIVAGIIYKRLEIGETLGVDATTQYGAGYSDVQKTWWRKGAELDKIIDINTPYNTRKNAGLPPTPISNPGESTFKAALNPEESNYLFYIHDDEGNIYFARTQGEHERNICRYLTKTC